MADESKLQLEVLERKIAVARGELNKLRSDVKSVKKMFVQRFKEVEELVKKEKQESTAQDICKRHTSGKNSQGKDTRRHETFLSEMKPIGFVESCFKEKNGIPRQPSVCPAAKAKLSVNVEGFTNPEHSLEGLEWFSHVWIIFLFHKNTNKAVKAKVKPPRLDGEKVGVFASRSPHRPSPIGLTLAKLDGIIGNTLLLSSIDLLEGTPVLDIKPYVPDYDKPLSLDGKDDLKRHDKTLCQNIDISKSEETISPPLPRSVNAQQHEVDQRSRTQTQGSLDLKTDSINTNIAEWIRKPPIKELNVKFSADAVAQIGCFHGNLLLRGNCQSRVYNGNVTDLSVQGCTCVQKPEELSERSVWEKTDRVYSQTKLCFREETTDRGCLKGFQTGETDYSDSKKEELKLPSYSKVSLDKKHSEVFEHSKGNGLKEIKVSVSDRGPIARDNVCDGFNEKSLNRSVPFVDHEVGQTSETCIYQMEMLSSPEEATAAITDILKADPRSVYRRNHCQDQLYRFSIDTMNVTCKFGDSTVEVLRVEPVYYRKRL